MNKIYFNFLINTQDLKNFVKNMNSQHTVGQIFYFCNKQSKKKMLTIVSTAKIEKIF